jgi:hypothetical protein
MNNHHPFMPHFYPVAHQTADLLHNLNTLKPSVFQAAYDHIQTQLTELKPLANHHQNATLWQQLSMISELIPAYYQLQQTLHNSENEANE